jgi:hypothetical protein
MHLVFRGVNSFSLIYPYWPCPYSCAITPVLSFLCITSSLYNLVLSPTFHLTLIVAALPNAGQIARHLCPPVHSLVLSDRPQVLNIVLFLSLFNSEVLCVRLRQLSGNHQAAADAGNRARPHSLTLRLSLWPTLLNRMGLELNGKPSLQSPVVQKY